MNQLALTRSAIHVAALLHQENPSDDSLAALNQVMDDYIEALDATFGTDWRKGRHDKDLSNLILLAAKDIGLTVGGPIEL